MDEMQTVVEDVRSIEDELGISVSQVKKMVSTSEFSVRMRSRRGTKLWSRMIALDVLLQRTLAASPMYSGPAARLLVQKRLNNALQLCDEYNIDSRIAHFAEERELHPVIYENLLARTQLLLRTGLILPSYMLSPSEIVTYKDWIPALAYVQQVQSFATQVSADLARLKHMYEVLPVPLDVQTGFTELWDRILSNLSIVSEWNIGSDSDRPMATVASVKEQISVVHYTNAPYLWADILKGKGHIDIKVVDGPRDGSIDVDSVNPATGDKRCLSQIKTWRNPPIGAEFIRQHAQTCRTYGAMGYFVTTHRYAKNAESGQYPLANNGTDERIKIAKVELVDLDVLTDYVLRHRIGITGAERLDSMYWAAMQIPHSRRDKGGE